MLRSPIVCILAHVDHGKTSILDKIRGTVLASKEAGGITQMIGAYYLPREAIISACGPLGPQADAALKVPGLLFIDTPGHEAFTSMRERGGSISDIAILVIDIMQGIQPQTVESLQILRSQKTPFVIALNKVDLLPGWKSQSTPSIARSLAAQTPAVQQLLEEKLYTIVGRLSEMGLNSERYDRVNDFTTQLIMVPTSAKTGEGMAELLLFLSGMCQKYLGQALVSEVAGPGKGSILEVKEEKGLGTTLDVIIYDGTIRKNDLVVFGTTAGARVVKIRGLLRPALPGEETVGQSRFVYIDEAHAAAGVKIYAPELEGALAGSPIQVVPSITVERTIEIEVTMQIKTILFEKDTAAGVVVKTDTLGSAEAFIRLLRNAGIPVRSVGIGPVSKKDVIGARSSLNEDPYLGVVLAFNVPVAADAIEEAERVHVPIMTNAVIYRLLENYVQWVAMGKKKDSEATLESVVLPARLKVLPNCFFRLCKPAIFGVEVMAGRLRTRAPLMTAFGVQVGEVKAIQKDGKSVEVLKEREQAAISVDAAYCGKTFKVGETLLVYIGKREAEKLRAAPGLMSDKEKALLEEIVQQTVMQI